VARLLELARLADALGAVTSLSEAARAVG